MNEHRIREINRNSDQEIDLVAHRMRETLIEVLGEEKGKALYSMEWLKDRVLWHLDPSRDARVFVSENLLGEITGHAIARIEQNDGLGAYGYFSTVYVEPKSRRQRLATKFLLKVEAWFREKKMPKIVYNTARNHHGLIRLFEAHGFEITLEKDEMVQLTKTLSNTPLDKQIPVR